MIAPPGAQDQHLCEHHDSKNRLLSKTDSRSGKHLNFGYDAVDNLLMQSVYSK